MLKKISILIFTMLLSSHALANKCDSLSIGPGAELEVTLPFNAQTIVDDEEHSGLCFSYELTQQKAICDFSGICIPYVTKPVKIICTLNNLENGWILYKENGVTKETASDAGTSTIILTSKEPTIVTSPTYGQYHVDTSGVIAIHHLGSKDPAQEQVTATCSYVAEE
jgi:hypothetical protein